MLIFKFILPLRVNTLGSYMASKKWSSRSKTRLIKNARDYERICGIFPGMDLSDKQVRTITQYCNALQGVIECLSTEEQDRNWSCWEYQFRQKTSSKR